MVTIDVVSLIDYLIWAYLPIGIHFVLSPVNNSLPPPPPPPHPPHPPHPPPPQFKRVWVHAPLVYVHVLCPTYYVTTKHGAQVT